MRNRTIAIIFLTVVISVVSITAASLETVDLEIKGYKISHVDDGTLELVVTDALTENLNPIEEAGSLDITNHLADLLGRMPTIPDFGRRVVFSYRVSGALSGSFRVDMFFTPMYLNGDASSAGKNTLINLYYSLQNENYVFLDSASSVSANGDSIKMNDAGYVKYGVAGRGDEGFVENLQLSTGWTVESVTDQCSLWIARGAVAMVVSKENQNYGYDNANPGTYKGFVTVKLTPMT